MFMFIYKLDKNIEFSEYDNPISFGIYTNKDITKEKHFGLNYIETKNTLERNDYKKIKVTKPSIIIIVILIVLGIVTSI